MGEIWDIAGNCLAIDPDARNIFHVSGTQFRLTELTLSCLFWEDTGMGNWKISHP
ncbi:hypothetical protein [[Phormidium ambiguum] IAM M-71]|uniref:hypothetical protein n=1 Tax=[Phormidium ambiguum] IAM M-71 TaxID=454136 RepID=UPI001C4A591D|nr:hypothetical protein [Phormidium ambiguum]